MNHNCNRSYSKKKIKNSTIFCNMEGDNLHSNMIQHEGRWKKNQLYFCFMNSICLLHFCMWWNHNQFIGRKVILIMYEMCVQIDNHELWYSNLSDTILSKHSIHYVLTFWIKISFHLSSVLDQDWMMLPS